MMVDGKIYGFPDDGDVFVFYYRKDMFGDPAIKEEFKAKFGNDLAVPQDLEGVRRGRPVPDRQAHRPKIYGAAFFRQPPYGMFMFQERFRNEGGKFFDAETMKATINSDIGVKVFDRHAGREQVHAAGRGAVGLRRKPRCLPAGPDGDDHLLAALWPLGRGLRHGSGGAELGAEIHDRRQGGLCHAARRTSAARGRLRAVGRFDVARTRKPPICSSSG